MTHRLNSYQTARLAVIAGLLTLAPGLANAQATSCPILWGKYAFSFSGTAVFPGSPTPAPYSGMGYQTFDGTGKWTGVESANFNGFIIRSAPFAGTYTLNPDCTGTMIAIFPDGSAGTSDFVVSKNGKTIYAMGVDNGGPGNTLTILFTRAD